MAETIEIEKHPLIPFLPKNGRILMLGSFPPQQKRWAMDFYYPNFINDMWRVFGLVFFEDPLHFVNTEQKTFRKEDIIDFLNAKGIGIYDSACEVRRLQDNASDKFLEVVTPTDIASLLTDMTSCKAIVTTGQKATDTICEYFNIEQPKVGSHTDFVYENPFNKKIYKLSLYRMPSTSRAYPLSLKKKAEIYKDMFSKLID